MSVIVLQGDSERQSGIRYEFDPDTSYVGQGGMGTVYEGLRIDERTGGTRRVAIKCLFDDLPDHVVARARREASIRLRNDNLVEMLAFIEKPDSNPLSNAKHYHVVSEFLDGVSLKDVLSGKTTSNKGESIPFAEEMLEKYRTNPYQFAIFTVRSILSALIAMHDAGYIHRDIDPSNIMLTKDRHIKLIDFGIAKLVGTLNTQDSLTSNGQFLGKAEYAAPELVLGDVRSQNATTDIYAVGITLFQLLVGHCPFEGPMHEVLQHQLKSSVPLKEVKQKSIRDVIRKATQKKQALRYQSAAEFRVDLDKLDGLPYPDLSFGEKYKTQIASSAIAVVVAGLVIGIGSRWVKNDNPDNPDDPNGSNKQSTLVLPPFAELKTLLNSVDENQVKTAFRQLESLSNDSNDYEATFLLSRLYYEDKSGNEIPDKEIVEMQKLLGIQPDNEKAHQLLVKAVSINPNDYKSLYELGCDFKQIDKMRGVEQNLDSARYYLELALEGASSHGDKTYIEMINYRLSNI